MKIQLIIQKRRFSRIYSKNEEGHGIKHINRVIKRSLKFAKNYDLNIDMIYTIASYHDLGHHIDRKKHEIIYLEDKEFDESIKKLRKALKDKKGFIKRGREVVEKIK